MGNEDSSLPELATLFQEAPCGLLVTDEDGTIRRANATFCRWVGYAETDLIGQRRLQEMFTMGGRIFHQTHWAPLLRMQGSIAEVKVDIVHRDGTQIPLLINATRRSHAQGIYHELAVFVAKDRSKYERELLLARRRAEDSLQIQLESQRRIALAEARLRLALEAGDMFVWDVDPVTQQRRYDDGVALLLGYDTARPVQATDILTAMPVDDRLAEAQALAIALQVPGETFHRVVHLNGVDGVRRVVHAAGIALFDVHNVPLQFVGVLQDISEHSHQRALAEDRAKFAEQMIGIVSHDLRNPLSTIRTGAELLARDQATPNQVRLLGHITRSTDRAHRLIADLLDFTLTRVGQGIGISKKEMELHSVIGRGLAELELAFPGRTLQHLTEGVGTCLADPDRLIQLLGNLVANAVTYGSPGAPIVVHTCIGSDQFSISVQNQGTPIPASLLQAMFEPMTRGTDIQTGMRSVGLGLFIVRAIARAHLGDVQVASTEREGTVFTARFRRPMHSAERPS